MFVYYKINIIGINEGKISWKERMLWKLVIDFLVIYGYFKVKLNVCKILWRVFVFMFEINIRCDSLLNW